MGHGEAAVRIEIAYGLVSQALIAAAAVRLLADLALRPGSAARRSAGDAPGPASNAAALGKERRISDLPPGVALAMMAGPIALLVPVAGCSVAEHMRGVWGDPSVITSAILAIYVARPSRLPDRPSRMMCVGVTLLVTVPLYGPLLGLNLPLSDLYAMGWQPYALLMAIALCAALGRVTSRWCGTWMAVLAIALLAYSVRMMESSNLLDYLADPGLLLTVAAMAALPRPRPSERASQGHAAHD